MNNKELINFIEDKKIILNDNWYYHATQEDIITIEKILEEGIKSAYLRNQKGNHFNGQYYISLYKKTKEAERLIQWLSKYPKFIIQDISPHYAVRKKITFRHLLINTKIPLRTSEWDGEYQEYLIIEPSKIIALEYSLSKILANTESLTLIKEHLIFLKKLILCLKQTKNNLPIIDSSTSLEINQNKVLSLHL